MFIRLLHQACLSSGSAACELSWSRITWRGNQMQQFLRYRAAWVSVRAQQLWLTALPLLPRESMRLSGDAWRRCEARWTVCQTTCHVSFSQNPKLSEAVLTSSFLRKSAVPNVQVHRLLATLNGVGLAFLASGSALFAVSIKIALHTWLSLAWDWIQSLLVGSVCRSRRYQRPLLR